MTQEFCPADKPVQVDSNWHGAPGGYRLAIAADRIHISAADPAAEYYARQTLTQLLCSNPVQLPGAIIEDWPDFPVRGVMLDISRDKVPTMATLYSIVDLLASLKINQLQLYTEHTFAYAGHEIVWQHASPMTADEIQSLDRYCAERFIELVPNQNSFGHLERWLKHPHYRDLAECPNGFEFPWGVRAPGGFSLNPLDPRSLQLVEDLYNQLLPHFKSQLLNVGCDETFDLGQGKSKSECDRIGKGRVYLEFLKKIHRAVDARGHRMMFWGDIILHHPELISDLPQDVIALNWGYEANHPFADETKKFADAGLEFYVCPGTSSWCSISGRSDNALTNLRIAAETGVKNGAKGYLNTDWGDLGHLQYWPVSLLPLAAGASFAWNATSTLDDHFIAAVDQKLFNTFPAGLSQWLIDFGNLYKTLPQQIANGSPLFWLLLDRGDRGKLYAELKFADYENAANLLGSLRHRLSNLAKPGQSAAPSRIVFDELSNALNLLHHSTRLGRWKLDPTSQSPSDLLNDLESILTEHRRLWLLRNRPGGLENSCSRLAHLLAEYRQASSSSVTSSP